MFFYANFFHPSLICRKNYKSVAGRFISQKSVNTVWLCVFIPISPTTATLAHPIADILGGTVCLFDQWQKERMLGKAFWKQPLFLQSSLLILVAKKLHISALIPLSGIKRKNDFIHTFSLFILGVLRQIRAQRRADSDRVQNEWEIALLETIDSVNQHCGTHYVCWLISMEF